MINNKAQFFLLAVSLLVLSGCATWSHSNVQPASTAPATQPSASAKIVDPAKILVTKEDISDKPYTVLADIEATVNKTTIFHDDPTPELVNEKLREEAAKLGADAVILVRYGTVGVSFMSWGSLDGKGRAIVFK